MDQSKMSTTTVIPRYEDVYSKKIDKYLSNCLIKMGAGLAVGSVFSLVLFRRRRWPVIFGLGSGFGMATNDLKHDLNEVK